MQLKTNFIPDGWSHVQLEKVATLQRGKDLPKTKQINGKYPVVGSSGIIGYHNEFICKGPGVVTGRSGSIGVHTYIENDFYPHNTGLFVKDFHNNFPKFIFYLFHTINFNKYRTGVSVPTLNRNFIHNELIKLPPLPEQKAISHILSTIQEAKEKTEAVIQASKVIKKSMMKHLFTYGPVPIDKVDKVKLKETEIGLMPEDWEILPLKDVATLQRGRDLPKTEMKVGEYPVVGSSGIIGYHNDFFCESNGVVTGRSGSIGKHVFIEKKYWAHNTGLYVKDFHENNPKYIFYLFHTIDFKKYTTGVSVPTLNRNFIHEHFVQVPPLPEQRKITEILESFDDKIESEEMKLNSIDILFKSALNSLMTGKIRVGNN